MLCYREILSRVEPFGCAIVNSVVWFCCYSLSGGTPGKKWVGVYGPLPKTYSIYGSRLFKDIRI